MSREDLLSSGVYATPNLVLEALNARAEQRGPTLTIRELGQQGGFVNTMSCKPAELSVFDTRSVEELSALRDLLVGKSYENRFVLRYGSRSLDPSEIYVVGVPKYFASEPTVDKFLETSGAPKRVIEPLLQSVGLEKNRYDVPRTLSESQRQRLIICAAFFSPAKILFFQEPFSRLEEQWVEPVARLMKESVQTSMQIYLVAGVEKLPAPWSSSPGVNPCRFELTDGKPKAKRKRIATGGLSVEMLGNVRTLMEHTHQKEDNAGFFITRPQTIRNLVVRAAVPEALQIEKIQNPDMKGFMPETCSIDQELAEQERSKEEERKRIATGRMKRPSLTRVSLIHRLIRDSGVVRFFMGMKRKVKAKMPRPELDPSKALPVSARLKQFTHSESFRRRFVWPAIVMLCLILALVVGR